MLCSMTLFISSHRFVNKEITPKWLCLMFAVGILGVVWSMLGRKISLKVYLFDYLFVTIIVFAIALSIHGMLQYADFLADRQNQVCCYRKFR